MEAAEGSEDEAKVLLMKQAIWQIYLPAPKHIPPPTFDVESPNSVFLPHDKIGRRVYWYALTVVDIASRFNAAESLTSKYSSCCKMIIIIEDTSKRNYVALI